MAPVAQGIIGPFYDANCTVDNEAECECGEGARTVAVRTAASSEVGARYSIAPSWGPRD